MKTRRATALAVVTVLLGALLSSVPAVSAKNVVLDMARKRTSAAYLELRLRFLPQFMGVIGAAPPAVYDSCEAAFGSVMVKDLYEASSRLNLGMQMEIRKARSYMEDALKAKWQCRDMLQGLSKSNGVLSDKAVFLIDNYHTTFFLPALIVVYDMTGGPPNTSAEQH